MGSGWQQTLMKLLLQLYGNSVAAGDGPSDAVDAAMETVDAAKSAEEATAVGSGASNEAPHMQAQDAEMADADEHQQQHGPDTAAGPEAGSRGQHYLVLCRENGVLQVSCIDGSVTPGGNKTLQGLIPQPEGVRHSSVCRPTGCQPCA